MTSHRRPRQARAHRDAEGETEAQTKARQASHAEAETGRAEAEQSRVLAEEGRELAEEIRRGAASLRIQQADAGREAENGRATLEAAARAESWFELPLDRLLDGVHDISLELKRLRAEAAELRQVLSDMQEAAREEQIITAERHATQQRMEREGFRDRR